MAFISTIDMKSIFANLFLLFALLASSSCLGADLMLRQRATQHGAVIRLGDIADISAAYSDELKGLANTPLMPAPASGTKLFLTVSQVRELLASRGIRLQGIHISGAKIVEVGALVELPINEVQPVVAVSPSALKQRVTQAIERYLDQQTNHNVWRVEVSLAEQVLQDIETLGENIQVRSSRLPRSGRERFFLSAGKGKKISVMAQVAKIQSVVVVKRPIERGQLIRMTDVALQEREGNLPSSLFTSLDQVIGKEAQRTFRPEELLLANQIRAPWQVRRGETVNAFVRTGGIIVRTRAIAKQNGAMGELIRLETLENKQRLDASVTGPGEVTIYATGGQATDYAMLNRERPRRK